MTVSVVIRNRNESDHLRRVLARIAEQRMRPLEVIVVDNESTDDSRKWIAEAGAQLVHLPAGEFTYGRSTNLGFSHCSGDLMLLLSAHSLPVGRYFLDSVVEPFEDPRVAAVRIPIAANTAELQNLEKLAPLDANSPAKDIFARGPVASGSVVRRSVWLGCKVDEKLSAAEDKEWAMRVLRSGDYIMPVAHACYSYTRHFTPDAFLRKIKKEELAGFQAAGLATPASLKDLVKSTLVAPRDVMHKVRFNTEMYLLRRRLK